MQHVKQGLVTISVYRMSVLAIDAEHQHEQRRSHLTKSQEKKS